MILILRSAAFNVAFYLNLTLWMAVGLPTLLMPRAVFMGVTKLWSRSSLWLLKVIAGTHFELRGAENIPKGGCIVVSKHQSAWEAFALFSLFPDPCFILKRELAWIPVFGWFVLKSEMIPIDRSAGASTMVKMNARALQVIAEGRQIIIFAEGTRRAPGAPPAYKQGFSHLYHAIKAPLMPLALNAGVFWPRRKFLRFPGTVVIEMLPAIQPGVPRPKIQIMAQEQIEAASNRLLEEAGWKASDQNA